MEEDYSGTETGEGMWSETCSTYSEVSSSPTSSDMESVMSSDMGSVMSAMTAESDAESTMVASESELHDVTAIMTSSAPAMTSSEEQQPVSEGTRPRLPSSVGYSDDSSALNSDSESTLSNHSSSPGSVQELQTRLKKKTSNPTASNQWKQFQKMLSIKSNNTFKRRHSSKG